MEGIRNETEVQKILGYAKLDESELKQQVQCLSFVEGLDNEAFRLLELDKSLINHLLEGEIVTIRGNKEDGAVLCTKDITYDVREAETSNALLLVPGCVLGNDLPEDNGSLELHSKEACGIKYSYYELRKIKPRLKRLKELLEDNMYSGWECEGDDCHQGKKYSMDDLLSTVQASENELKKRLHQLQACEIEGYWRMLDFDFLGKVLHHILSLVEEQDWSMDAIPLDSCCRELDGIYPRNVVLLVLESYSDVCLSHQTDETNESRTNFRISEDKVCRFYAEMILRPAEKFSLEDFEQTWQLSVPEGMKTIQYQLEGLALVERDTKPQIIRYFPLSELPEDVDERFDFLFKTKPKWTLAEITPYVRDLAAEKTGVSALLTKHTRASNMKGVKMYSSRKTVS